MGGRRAAAAAPVLRGGGREPGRLRLAHRRGDGAHRRLLDPPELPRPQLQAAWCGGRGVRRHDADGVATGRPRAGHLAQRFLPAALRAAGVLPRRHHGVRPALRAVGERGDPTPTPHLFTDFHPTPSARGRTWRCTRTKFCGSCQARTSTLQRPRRTRCCGATGLPEGEGAA